MEHFAACLSVVDVLMRLLTASVIGLTDTLGSTSSAWRGYKLSRTSGTGDWVVALDESMSEAPRTVRPESSAFHWVRRMQQFLLQASSRDDLDSLKLVAEPVFTLRNELLGVTEPFSRLTPIKLARWLVEIRNKTVGHGNQGTEFWSGSVGAVSDAADWLVSHDLLFEPDLTVVTQGEASTLGRVLRGNEPTLATPAPEFDPGAVVCRLGASAWELPPLVWVRPSDNHTFIANGSWRDADSSAEFLCHAIAATDASEGRTRRPLPVYGMAPTTQAPRSETHGLTELDMSGAVCHNLPPAPESYVSRTSLEAELRRVLEDPMKRHLLNLKGIGGIGKTSLVLRIAREMLSDPACPYSQMIWISARDVDLTLRGPKRVQKAEADLNDVFTRYSTLWGEEDPSDPQAAFEEALRDPGAPVLLILDNFETFAAQKDAYRYLDDVVQPPSKVVITSRHDFQGDFQIQVQGMELNEAAELIRGAARRANREGLLDQQGIERIFATCQGHPYAMKLVASNVTTRSGLQDLISRTFRDEAVLNALFRESVRGLRDPELFVFLLASRFSSGVSDVALRVGTMREEIDLAAALAILHERSLIDFDSGTELYIVPAMAREYANRELVGHVHRSNVEAAEKYVKSWHGLAGGYLARVAIAMEVAVVQEGESRDGRRTADTLRELAEHDSSAWKHLARVLQHIRAPESRVDDAYKRAVEAEPQSARLFLEWAEAVNPANLDRRVDLRVQAATANPEDFKVASQVASFLAGFRHAHRSHYDSVRWNSLIRPVLEVLEAHRDRLDANDCSRLAWLYLFVGEEAAAKRTVERGLELDAENVNLQKLAERLRLRR